MELFGFAACIFAFFLGLALLANGCTFVEIHKHYHKDDETHE